MHKEYHICEFDEKKSGQEFMFMFNLFMHVLILRRNQ